MEPLTSKDYPVPTTQQLAKVIEELDARLKKLEGKQLDLGSRADNIAGKMGTTADLNSIMKDIGVVARAAAASNPQALTPGDQQKLQDLTQL